MIRFVYFLITFILFSVSLVGHAFDVKKADLDFYKKVFPQASNITVKKIDDPVSKLKEEGSAANDKLLIVHNKEFKTVGYLRDIVTSTGCNDGCLPVIFTLFFSSEGKFIKLLSKTGLTKRNHAPFTKDDYMKLELILLRNPESFKSVAHPKMMVDAVTLQTLKLYEKDVVSAAAYTSLRVNLYYQSTKKQLEKMLSTKVK